MSAQRLNARNTRKIARATGQDVLRAWSHGGYVMAFVTTDHYHGWFDKKTGDWGWEKAHPQLGITHYTSCIETFGTDYRAKGEHP